jgi:chemotaxis protein MotA
MSPRKVIVDLVKGMLSVFKGSPYSKPLYLDTFKVLFALARLARRDGILGLDKHVSAPKESPIFQKFPMVSRHHHVLEFICNSVGLLTEGKASAEQLQGWLETEIHVLEREHHDAVAALAKTADALPGFGIVAAVLGIVITMGAIDGPAEEIGEKVGAALVGTFLGILLSYGFVAPMAARMEFLGAHEMNFFRTVAAAVASMIDGISPRDVIATACRRVGTECKPNRQELEQIFKDGEVE